MSRVLLSDGPREAGEQCTRLGRCRDAGDPDDLGGGLDVARCFEIAPGLRLLLFDASPLTVGELRGDPSVDRERELCVLGLVEGDSREGGAHLGIRRVRGLMRGDERALGFAHAALDRVLARELEERRLGLRRGDLDAWRRRRCSEATRESRRDGGEVVGVRPLAPAERLA